MVLDRNPVNYFAEVEQLAFSPSNMVPGIEPSPDKMLQVTNLSCMPWTLSKRKLRAAVNHYSLMLVHTVNRAEALNWTAKHLIRKYDCRMQLQ